MANKPPKSHVAGRDARNGQFIPIRETYRRPSTTVREHIPNPGFGVTDRSKK